MSNEIQNEDFHITIIKRGSKPLSPDTQRLKKQLRERLDLMLRPRGMDYAKLMEICSMECGRKIGDLCQMSFGELNRVVNKLEGRE